MPTAWRGRSPRTPWTTPTALTGCTDLEATQEAEQLRELLLARGADFTFETVLSTDRNLSLLRRAKEAGYEICVVFVLTSDVEINVRRVQERATAGGHDVPEDKIKSRYGKSIRNLSPLVRIADKTRVLDNSGAEPCLICEGEGNAVRIWDNDVWTKNAILRLLEKRD